MSGGLYLFLTADKGKEISGECLIELFSKKRERES
jgi:hypothetical protein